MSDNSSVPVAVGNETFANNDIGGVKYPRQKVTWGPAGTANDTDVASGKPMPVQLRGSDGTDVSKLLPVTATLGAETTKVIGTVNISASQTVTAAQATAANLKATVLLQDGSGTALTSTTGALDINVKSGVNANDINIPANSAPVVNTKYYYQTIAASTGPTTLAKRGSGATGDTVVSILVVPSATTIGAITLKDGAGTPFNIYAGGTYNADLKPFVVELNGIASAAGAWAVTTLAGASVVVTGVF